MTIPNLMTKYQKQATITKLRVAESMFSNALKQAYEANEGCLVIRKSDIKSQNSANSNWYPIPELSELLFDPYIAGASEYKHPFKIKYKTPAGTDFVFGGKASDAYHNTEKPHQRCTPKGICYAVTNIFDGRGESTIELFFDINGPTGPNRAGRDVFVLGLGATITDSEISFTGEFSDVSIYNTSSPREDLVAGCTKDMSKYHFWATGQEYDNGSTCLLLIKKDGWAIADDYPW